MHMLKKFLYFKDKKNFKFSLSIHEKTNNNKFKVTYKQPEYFG